MTEYFDGLAQEYPSIYNAGWWRQYRRRAYKLVRRLLPPLGGLSVLDLGGGALISLPDLLSDPRVERYVVVDLVDRLPVGLPKVEFVASDVVSYLRESGGTRFDAVVIFGVLMYLSAGDASELMRRVPSVMAPAAPLLVHEPTHRASRDLQTHVERPVDVVALASAGTFSVIRAERHNVARIRRVIGRLDGPVSRLGWKPLVDRPKLLALLLACERWSGRGRDGLYLLRRRTSA